MVHCGMVRMKKYIVHIAILVFMIRFAAALPAEQPQTNSLELQFNAGIGMFPGEFGRHLDSSGAWPWTPVIDGLIVFYPLAKLGIGTQWGSMAVIHPNSEPIEGILRYQSLFLEYPHAFGKITALIHLGAGFQDAGMLLSVYSSGFWNTGLSAKIPLVKDFSFIVRGDYRRSFFKSLLINREYDDWQTDDNLQSLSLSLGLRYGK